MPVGELKSELPLLPHASSRQTAGLAKDVTSGQRLGVLGQKHVMNDAMAMVLLRDLHHKIYVNTL